MGPKGPCITLQGSWAGWAGSAEPLHPDCNLPCGGTHSPQEFLWEKEGSPALKMTQERALIFPLLNKSDSGTYGCTATSNMGSSKAYYTLNVHGEILVQASTAWPTEPDSLTDQLAGPVLPGTPVPLPAPACLFSTAIPGSWVRFWALPGSALAATLQTLLRALLALCWHLVVY